MRCSLRFPLLLLATLTLPVAAIRPAGAQSADLQLVKLDSPDPVSPGSTINYDIILTNAGPDTSEFLSLEDTVPAGTTFVSFFATDPAWTCSTPMVGSAGGTVSCSIDSLAADSGASFTMTVAVDAGVTSGTVITNTATASAETPDPDEGGPSASAETTVLTPPPTADVSVTKVDNPDPVLPGADLVYTITVSNSGPANATSVNLVDPLPPETTFVSLPEPPGWSCITPAVGTNDAVVCSIPTLGPGSAVFTLTVAVDPAAAPGAQIFNTATVSSANDLDEGNNNGSASTQVTPDATAVSIAKSDSPDPVAAGASLLYSITATNSNVGDLDSATVTDTLPAGTTFGSLNSVPAGWMCTTPPAGTSGTVTCSAAPFPPGSASISFFVNVNSSLPAGTVLSNTANLIVIEGQTVVTREATTTTEVITSLAISATKSVAGNFTPGGAVTYTVVLTNSGPGAQADNAGDEFTDLLPATLTLVSASATLGTATATVATNTVTWNGSLAAGASVTLTINATIKPAVASGTTVSNQGTVNYDSDADGSNDTSAVTDDPATQPSGDPTSFQVAAAPVPLEIPALDGLGLAILAALLSLAGALALRRRRA